MITITKDLNEAKFVTHAGNFHADDVFSTVLLEGVFGKINLIRLKEYQDDGSKLAYDIGCGKFDHHQANAKVRDNGLHYCSFGLLWQEYGLEYLKKWQEKNLLETFKVFDNLLVKSIDAIDNGELSLNNDFNIYTISTLIELFRPKHDSNDDENVCFLEAVDFARNIFHLVMQEATTKVKIIEKIKQQTKNIKDRVLILDEYIPYEYAIFHLGLDKDIDFVIYPSNRGGYAAHTVPIKYKGFTPKIPFKKEWAGLRNEELQKLSNVKTANFCHRSLFLATADTLEDALKLVLLSK